MANYNAFASFSAETYRQHPIAEQLGQSAMANCIIVPEIEEFRTHEPLADQAKRLYCRIRRGADSWRSRKPNQYDTQGYQAQMTEAVEVLVHANDGSMHDQLYDIAAQASHSLDAGSDTYEPRWDYPYNHPQGAQDLGTARAIIHHPGFVTSNPQRAAQVLSGLGSVESDITHDMFVTFDQERRQHVLQPSLEPTALDIFGKLIAQDTLWIPTRDRAGYRRLRGQETLKQAARGLNILSATQPLLTAPARLNILARNVDTGEPTAALTREIVYTFRSDGEKQWLQSIADDPGTPATKRRLAQDILGGRWKNTCWAT